jgi:hypothetical protein
MTDISSVASSATAYVNKQASDLGKAASSATTSFAAALSKAQSAIIGRPKTGFTSGPTYEAGTIAGKTKAAFTNALNATKHVLSIKP